MFKKKKKEIGIYDNRLTALLFLLPNIILYILFFAIPFIWGFAISFTNYDGISGSFVGLENYITILQDPKFVKAVVLTTIYALITVPIGIAAALGAALLVNSHALKGRNFHKAVIYFPVLLSAIVSGIMWKWMFGENYGVINYLLSLIGIAPVLWSTSTVAAWMSLIISGLLGIGGNMLMYLGGLNSIPTTYYEAADIDGASTFYKFKKVTWPLLTPTTYLIFTLSMVGAFQAFAFVQTLTGGGPGTDTTFIVQFIYSTGFNLMQIGYASAASMILFSILLTLTIIREKFARGGRVYD